MGYRVFHCHGGYPKKWMVLNGKIPSIYKWMMTGGTPMTQETTISSLAISGSDRKWSYPPFFFQASVRAKYQGISAPRIWSKTYGPVPPSIGSWNSDFLWDSVSK